MKGTVYAIISTAKSDHYTDLAVDSFIKNTRLAARDEFYLIDNDNTGKYNHRNISVINNPEPKSFARNANDIIALADGRDVIILNNDIVFTSDWDAPLKHYADTIMLPCCNQTHIYSNQNLTVQPSMKLDQFTNDWDLLDIVKQHKSSAGQGFFEKLLMPFYAVRIPHKVYSQVGLFDESFGLAGGEDVDYRLRAIEQGFSVKYSKQSYLLHFQGKSTWDGAEYSEQTLQRDAKYVKEFSEKWGSDLARLFLVQGDYDDVIEKYMLASHLEQEDFTGLIKKMLSVRKGDSIIPEKNVSADGLLEYVRKLGDNLVGCELGVCWAWTLRYFLDKSPEITKVYAVDAYQPYQDWWGPVTRIMVDAWKQHALALLKPHQDRVKFLEMDSISAADHIPDRSLDYIFIDGDHSYAAVSRDLRAYWPKMKQGAIFAGHDWNLPDVSRAVTDFRKEFDINTEIQHTSKNVWFWYK